MVYSLFQLPCCTKNFVPFPIFAPKASEIDAKSIRVVICILFMHFLRHLEGYALVRGYFIVTMIHCLAKLTLGIKDGDNSLLVVL